MKMCYTGIGSRETPRAILQHMTDWGYILADRDLTLRSGKAAGADEAFQLGVEYAVDSLAYKGGADHLCEIYTPWENFTNKKLSNRWDITPNAAVMSECLKIASKFHPAWGKCRNGAKKLHGRNVCQVLGLNLYTPSKFVLYYAQEDSKGNVKGGTATAVNIARSHNIPTINMLHSDWEDLLVEEVENLC